MSAEKIVESLSPNEIKILPHLNKDIEGICKDSNLDRVSVLRSLEFLKNKKIIGLNYKKDKIIEIGVNGALYKKKGLPERRLLNLLADKHILKFQDAQKKSGLSNDEFKASLGALKKKSLIDIKNGNIHLNANREEISKKSLEEQFIEMIPIKYESLKPEHIYALKNFQSRKDIIIIKEEQIVEINITPLGKDLMGIKISQNDFIEQITPELLKKETLWKNKKFRRYDLTSPVPSISGGKRHFVNQAIDYGRKIWTDMGFQEMTGNIVESSFWVFDALFTAQDHPVREMQDTFFINKKTDLPDKKIVEAVKKTHETGIDGSKGWRYSWDEEESKRVCLRTHTTCLSARTLANLKKENLPAKFFAIGKVMRNETVDWSHGFEFYQTEGIVVDKNVNFRHLLGYLKQFYEKMGFKNVRFSPAYFPYTEPSVEIHAWHPEKEVWLELGGAGIFRPEITVPLLGTSIPVLAWGQGFDRIITDYYKIKDLRDLYHNNITKSRKMKNWMK